MNKKFLTVCIIVIVILGIVAIRIKTKNGRIGNSANGQSDIIMNSDETKNSYEIIDENTGEVLYTTMYKESAEEWLDFYQRNPDYRETRTTENMESSIEGFGDELVIE